MRRSWRLVLVVIGVIGLLGTGYAWIVSSPTGTSPDDDYHQTSIWCPTPIEKHCPIVGTDDEGHPIVEVPQTVVLSTPALAFSRETSGFNLTGLSDSVMQGTNRVDDGDYPGFYYDFMHMFVEHDVDRTILVVRWVNFTIAVVMFGAALLLLGTAQKRLLVYTLICGALPINFYFTTSVNPSSWAYTGIASLWIGLEGFFTSHGARRVGLGAVALLGAVLASAARTDASMYCVIIAVAVTLFHLRRVWGRKLLLLVPLAAAAVGTASYLSTRQAASLNVASSGTVLSFGDSVYLFLSNAIHLRESLLLFWTMDLGWSDVPSPIVVGDLLLAVTIIWAGYCLIKARCDWHKLAALVIVGGSIYLLPLVFLQLHQSFLLGVWGFQVRYVAPLIIVFFGMLMAGSPANDPPRLPWWLSAPCLIGLVVAHGILLHSLIRRYTTGTDVTGFNLNPGAEWWRGGGPSPMGTWVLGSVGLAVALACCIAVLMTKASTAPGPSSAKTGPSKQLSSSL